MKNNSVDKLKAIACYMVVLNHFHPGGVLGDITYAISHFGVPVFFIVSGYFFLDNRGEISIQRLSKKVRHIGLLLICHIALYTFYEVFSKVLAGNSIISAVYGLKTYFNAKNFAKTVLLGTGIMGGGEWFLVSLLDAYIVLGLCMENDRIRNVVKRYSHIIAAVLFLVHIPIRMYAIKSGVETIGSFSLIESYAVRNTWLDAIPFLLMGISIKNYHDSIRIIHPVLMSVFAMIIGIGERFYNAKMIEPYSTHDVLYFGIIMAVIFAFIWAIYDCGKESRMSLIGSRYSMLIYFLHPIIGWTLQSVFTEKYINTNIINECVFTIAVMFVTTVAAVIIDSTKRKIIVKG